MKTLYIECNMGAAGDMLMAALYDLLEDQQGFLNTMNGLGLPGVHVEAQKGVTCGIAGTHMAVTVHGEEEKEPVEAHAHDHHDHDHHHDHEHDHCCGHDHHHHHADEVFTSWGRETAHRYTEEELDFLLKALSETEGYGTILRSKGIIGMADGSWKQFDLVPEEYEVREGQPDYTGRICVIGTDLKEEELEKLFHI